LTATSNEGGLTYLWSTGASTQQISVNTSAIYSATATNTFGCSSSDSVQVTVNALPSLTLGQDQSVCSNDLPAILNAQSSATGLVYVWSTNQSTQQIQVNSSGTYSVTVTDGNGCESSDAVAVQTFASPNVNAGQDVTVCENNFPVTLNATGNGSQVEWSTGAQTPTITVANPGTYIVTTTAQNGCQASDSVIVTSDPCASLVEQNNGILIYPNPTQSTIVILNKTDQPLQYILRTVEGKIIAQGELDSNSEKTSLDLSNLSNGAYLIHVFNAELNYIKRITKQ
jgi:hypothetical protein